MKKYFTIAELCESDTADEKGIDNTPTSEARDNMTTLIDKLLHPVRVRRGKVITTNSGFRCLELNKAVGGSKTSQHMLGEAADVTTGTMEGNRELFALVQQMVKEGLIAFDQLIIYGNGRFLHLSYREGRNRGQILYK